MGEKELSLKDKILANVKAEGLEITEEAAKALVPVLLGVVKTIVEDTSNPFDDMVYATMKTLLETELLELAEKINKADNE